MPKFDTEVQLSGQDGNAFAIITRVRVALREAGATIPEINEFATEAMSGDYDNVLQTVAKWVEIA